MHPPGDKKTGPGPGSPGALFHGKSHENFPSPYPPRREWHLHHYAPYPPSPGHHAGTHHVWLVFPPAPLPGAKPSTHWNPSPCGLPLPFSIFPARPPRSASGYASSLLGPSLPILPPASRSRSRRLPGQKCPVRARRATSPHPLSIPPHPPGGSGLRFAHPGNRPGRLTPFPPHPYPASTPPKPSHFQTLPGSVPARGYYVRRSFPVRPRPPSAIPPTCFRRFPAR